MKIGDTCGPRVYEGPVQKTAGDVKGGEFRAVMDEVLGRAAAAEAPQTKMGAVSPGAVELVQGTDPIRSGQRPPGPRDLIFGLEGALDAVAFYTRKLADPAFPVRNLAPVLDHLEETVGTLNRLGAHAELPAGLRDVLSEVTITVGTEIARFRRGDYD
jgi:hypothetical protein